MRQPPPWKTPPLAAPHERSYGLSGAGSFQGAARETAAVDDGAWDWRAHRNLGGGRPAEVGAALVPSGAQRVRLARLGVDPQRRIANAPVGQLAPYCDGLRAWHNRRPARGYRYRVLRHRPRHRTTVGAGPLSHPQDRDSPIADPLAGNWRAAQDCGHRDR